MFRNKKIHRRNMKQTGTAVLLIFAVCLMTVSFTGCYIRITPVYTETYETSVSTYTSIPRISVAGTKAKATYEETSATLKGNSDELKLAVSSKYSVNIVTGKDAVKDLPGNVKAGIVDDETKIVNAINMLVPLFERFGKTFFEEFRYGTSKGLNLLMVGRTDVTNYGETIDADGAAFKRGDAFNILVNINSIYVKLSFCHELMHAMEQNSDPDSFFPEWNYYNPNGFKYGDSDTDHRETKYTIGELNVDDAYFCDTYSKRNAKEDRARIFENLVGTEKNECCIRTYPHIEAKAVYIKKCILKRYPSLKNTDIFRNLDD